MVLNCVIVEDEPLAVEKLKRYLPSFPFLNLLAVFNKGTDALVFLKSEPVDLVLLDINLGRLSGIQLLELTSRRFQVILTTAYQEYALKGFELNVTDYLLKPFTFERFAEAIEKVRLRQQLPGISAPAKDYVMVRTEYRLEKIHFQDILYIEGRGNYRQFHLTGKRIMTLRTFKELEEEIPSSCICRVHKSFMVALDKVESIGRDRIRIGKRMIPLSETYRKAFFEIIGHSGKEGS